MSTFDDLQKALGSTYRLDRELGGGGMSRVFLADDPALGRKVVLKVLPVDLAAVVNVERFNRETMLLARLQHPHIVPVLTVGTLHGLPWFSMPFIEGESLRARIERERELPIADVVSVMRDVAKALAYAHERGVVHRDIKPDNILLTGDAATVADFGIAKAINSARTDHADHAGHAGEALTQMGVSIGTPAYMSPEQIVASDTVDHRADLYALGCVAYEMLCGKSPFADRPFQAQISAHLSEAPESIAPRRAQVPAALATLVMQCLEKDPAKRPQEARDLVLALEQADVRSGEVTATMIAAPPRRRASLLVLGGVLLAVAGFFGLRALGVIPGGSLLASGVFAKLKMVPQAKAALADFDRLATAPEVPARYAAARSEIVNELAIAEGRWAEAAAVARRSDQLADGPASSCVQCLPLDLLRLFATAGVADSAIAQYELYRQTPTGARPRVGPEVNVPAPTMLALARIFDARGDSVRALAANRDYATRYARADAELQPSVREARARVMALTGEGTKR